MKTETPVLDRNATATAGAPAGAPGADGFEDSAVRLGDRYEILPARRLDGVDRPFGDCFSARRTDLTMRDLVAIATGPVPLARTGMLQQFKAVDQAGLWRLFDWGLVDWSPNERHFVMIFDRLPGAQLMKSMDEVIQPLSEELLVKALLLPACYVLQELAGRGLSHGGIRPTNVYYNPTGGRGGVLGECVSAPVGYLQPAVCEPLERAMADPSGRGPGTISDDLYALGATAVILALGQNPLRTMPADAQIEQRTDRGSLAVMTAGARFSSGLAELLRGLLADDPHQRWTLDDLSKWLNGRRQSPRISAPIRKAQRPIVVAGTEVWHPRVLAGVLGRNVPEAFKLVQSGEIDRWLRRNVGDTACAMRLEAATSAANPGRGGAAAEERLVSRVCMALDPTGPIRYRGRAILPKGIGDALADAVAQGAPVQAIAELISAQLPLFWQTIQPDSTDEAWLAVRASDQFRGLLDRTGLGFGVERLVYELVPWAPCFSEPVRKLYVTSPSVLLQALENMAGNPEKRPSAPMDRHIVGFLAARDRGLDDKQLNALSGAIGEADRQMATLNLLSGVQRRVGPAELPKVAGWMVSLMEPLVERFHNRKTRQVLRRDMAEAARRGDLSELQHLVDDPETVSKDFQGFSQAQAAYAQLAGEIARTLHFSSDRTRLEHTLGRETAAVVACAIAALAAGLVMLLELGK